jgi:hypothetical protein
VSNPLFWLGISILLVSASLTAVLVVAIPALQELSRASRSAEKLFDTLSRELPPTLDAIRMTSLEITDLTDDVSEGVRSASQVVKQVDQSLESAKKQAQSFQIGTRSLVVGVKAAWKSFTYQKSSKRKVDRLPSPQKGTLTFRDREAQRQENRRTTGEYYDNDNHNNDGAGKWGSRFEEQDLYRQPTVAEDWSDQDD